MVWDLEFGIWNLEFYSLEFMKIAILSPVAWRTPPRHYGPWEQMASNLAEGLVAKGQQVTLFATANSVTGGVLAAISPEGYEEDKELDPKVQECMHISYLMEQAGDFDIIHNHFDFLPLTYSRLIRTPMVTTIHGFSSPKIIPVYARYNDINHYVSISYADRSPALRYTANVYNGIHTADFPFEAQPEDYLLYFGRIHPDKGTFDAIQIALATGHRLIIAGIIQDTAYYEEKIKPFIDGQQVIFAGAVGGQERSRVLGRAKALLHPIYFEEPFGLSVAEAMLCGTPVIAYQRGAMPELIQPGKTGFLVNTQQQAINCIADIERIDRRYCHTYAQQKFGEERMVEEYLKVYTEVLG
ncbi:glycosyltransferase involved in cell wall biosynthesis [Chitinophaga japonensis]|uniref:Glycosyltransferase involved in cell wall biosynthesis n=2 Tax=Chitinophaga japonensis TaxID=104662 RepID=A0A562T0N0_CHIJA|nr:glycosyltransferase involved in cell wall biosynthesis [Chitinophaga japonensis]